MRSATACGQCEFQCTVGPVSGLSLSDSIAKAERRLGPGGRARRSDRGRSRIAPEAERHLQRLLQTRDKPSITAVAKELDEYCRRQRIPSPSRASVYNAVARAPAPSVRVAELPAEVQRSLYNLRIEASRAPDAADDRNLPGDQVVFYAFNYGSPRAISYAAGLPWLCLVRATRRPGWRPKSHALLRAVMAYRGV